MEMLITIEVALLPRVRSLLARAAPPASPDDGIPLGKHGRSPARPGSGSTSPHPASRTCQLRRPCSGAPALVEEGLLGLPVDQVNQSFN